MTKYISKAKAIGLRFFNVITLPFSKNLKFFLILLILASGPIVLNTILKLINGTAGIDVIKQVTKVFLDYFVECWVIAFIYSCFQFWKKWLALGFKYIVLALTGIMSILDIACINALHSPFLGDFVLLIKSTNGQESSEFFSFYFTPIVWINIAFTIILMAVLIYLSIKLGDYIKNKSYSRLDIIIRCLSLVLLLAGYGYQKYMGLRGNIEFNEYLRRVHIIRTIFYTPKPLLNPTPPLSDTQSPKPQHIVIIMGESLAPYHMSLYGYNKSTTPNLEKLRNDSLLVVYPNINSPYTCTNISISRIMTSSMAEGKDYSESYTIPAVAKEAGYKTTWLSMQNEKGYADNIVSSFAYICDNYKFLSGAVEALTSAKELDEKILPAVSEIANADSVENHLTIVHLMGQHPSFDRRFPSNRIKYTPSDYNISSFDNTQRQTLSNYDNSVIYNDSVVSQMFKYFEDKEAIIIYTSDHSLDIYQSGYCCGHANINDPKSREIGLRVPFLVYMSKKYRDKFPSMVNRVENTVGRPYDTGYLLYTIMDLMGVEFEGKDDVGRYSLFRN